MRLPISFVLTYPCRVSIHAPRAGCDCHEKRLQLHARCFNSRTPCGVRQYVDNARYIQDRFQFTHPVRGATTKYIQPNITTNVSIHAPRAGCDLPIIVYFHLPVMFQFTHPVRGATMIGIRNLRNFAFQFTHPVRGATSIRLITRFVQALFQFTHPVRGATQLLIRFFLWKMFQFTHPVRGATAMLKGTHK